MDVNLENLMGDGLGIGAHDESYNGKQGFDKRNALCMPTVATSATNPHA